MSFPSLTAQEQLVMDALRFDGATVEDMKQENSFRPQLAATYRGVPYWIRVPTLEANETLGLEIAQGEAAWDSWWDGPVINSGDATAILTAILSTPLPGAEVVFPAVPAGLYATVGLTYDNGAATQPIPGAFSSDAPLVRARSGSTQFTSAELWFQWLGDATAPSGTTRNVGVLLRETDANNAIEVLWEWGPSNIGIKVQRRVAGVVTVETSTAANIPPAPNDSYYHRLRVDLVGSVLTVRCDGANPIAWQGTLSGAATAITGAPGMLATNGKLNFCLWTPPAPSSATKLRYHITPQANRPGQMIEAAQYPINGGPSSQPYSGNITIERIVAVAKTDRVNFLPLQTGFTGIASRFKPEPGDLFNNGNRANVKATATDVAKKKCFLAYSGDRTRDTFKMRINAATFLGNTDYSKANGLWRLLWQWHQESVGSSPPIQLVARQHYVTGLWWLFLSVLPDYWGNTGLWNSTTGGNQSYTNFMNADGTWSTGGEIKWIELLQLDHTYTIQADIYHSNLDVGATETATMKRGQIKSLLVDGVTKVSNLVGRTMYDTYNFSDFTLYQRRNAVNSSSVLYGDAFHEHLPGVNNPLFGVTP